MTQWPRFEVFEQEKEGRPHLNAGSVHAPDAEMALQNARDVFVRRPSCHSLWVAPAEAILARTAQQMEADGSRDDAATAADGVVESYYVFQKKSQRRSMNFVAHVGEVAAQSAEEALARAVDKYGADGVYVWWVCPARLVTRSDPAETESLFAPAHDKSYRQPKEYHVLTQMQEIRQV